MTANPSNRERGSLPLALLVVIIVAGLVVVLVSRTVATQTQARFDQGFHASLPTADAGVNLAKSWLNDENVLLEVDEDSCDTSELDGTSPFEFAPRDFPVGCKTIEYDQDIAGSDYVFTLERLSQHEWEADSTGEDARSGIERRVIGTISERPLVETALFADTFINFSGNNFADSYNSSDEEWCTGNGFIATNGDLDLSGVAGGPCHDDPDQNRTIDQGFLHDVAGYPIENATEEYPGGDRCVHDGGGGGANCRDVSTEGPPAKDYPAPALFDQPLELTLEHKMEFIGHAIDACKDLGEPMGTYKTSEQMEDGVGVLRRGTFDPSGASTEPFEFPGDLDGEYHCFDELVFDVDTRIDADGDDPVIIVVNNAVKIEGGGKGAASHVGCYVSPGNTRCVSDPDDPNVSSPEAARLWVFVAPPGEVAMGNHSAFAGIIWGPGAECDGGAQADIFGSIICGSLPENLGSWQFHYDDMLAEVSSGEFYTSAWREEVRNP